MIRKIRTSSLIAIFLLLSDSSQLLAQNTAVTTSTPIETAKAIKPKLANPMSVRANLVLESTTVNVLNTPLMGNPIGVGYSQIDATQVECKNTSGCLIVTRLSVQVGKNTAANNHWGFCSQVDGQWVEPNNPQGGCLWQGLLPSDTWFVEGNVSGSIMVKQGMHNISTVVYVQGPASIGQSEFEYAVYK